MTPARQRERERDEYLELAQRAQADFENYRKRAAREAAAAGERAKGGLVRELLPVVDNLERALGSAERGRAAPGRGREARALRARRACSSATASSSSTRRASRSTPTSTRRSRRAARRAPSRASCSTWSRRATGSNGTVLRPARVVVSGERAMPAVKDPYKTLGVDKKASDDEIKKAYRKLARQYHPDSNPGDAAAEERFKEIQEAYSILSDPEKRRSTTPAAGSSARLRPGRVPSGGGSAGGFGDILSDLFGGGGGGAGGARRARSAARPRDRGAHLLRAGDGGRAGAGQRAAVGPLPHLPRHRRQAGHPPTVCSRCNGRGVEAESQGLFSISQPCRSAAAPAPRSRTLPDVRRRRRHAPGQALPGEHPRRRARRQPRAAGRQGRGRAARRPAGDLYVVTRVTESPVFRRRATTSR